MPHCTVPLRLSAALSFSLIAGFTTSALSQDPSVVKKAEGLYAAGSAAFAKNDLQAALADFQAVVHLLPSSEAGHSSLGVVLLRMGRARESVPELQQALKMKPSDDIAQTSLALAYEQLQQPEKVIAILARLEAATHAQGHPLPPEVSVMYARALAATHRLPMAIAQMQKAVAADPHNAVFQDNLGSLYAMEEDWPRAEQSFRAAIAADAKLASAHLHLALALQAAQRSGGLEELNAAYELDPTNPVISLELGRTLSMDGKDQQALPLLERANQAMPQNPEAAYQLALALQRAGRLSEAMPLFEHAAAALPGNADVLTNYGLALCQEQKAADAVPILQKAVALAPKNPTALENLAAAYIQLNRVEDAVTQLRAAIPLSPDSPQLHYNLGLAFKMQDDPAHAIPELEAAERLDPNQPESKYALGMLYMQSGRYEDAARELGLSLKMQPNNGDGWATLGSVYGKLDKYPEAEGALRQAIAQIPEQPDPHLTLAAVLVKEGKPEDATAERKTAAGLMRTHMNRQRAEVATNSGNALFQRGDLEGAKLQFRDALTFDGNYKEAHEGLARVLDAQGRTADAAAERAKLSAKQQ